MKNNYDLDVSTQGNLSSDDIEFTIDEDALVHLRSVLTNLYSDPELAVIREYSTNALDSHKAAGNDAPIEVSLPNSFRPTFVVRDYGTGLSVDDLTNIVSKYGASTKRDNNVESGMLGLGFKAGLTYTSQFTVEAVKDGVKVIAIISVNDEGIGTIKIVDTSGSLAPNGVTISVPVTNPTKFNYRANLFFRWWDEGTVLVDGKPPARVEGMWLDDTTLMFDSTDEPDYIVMGNIAYPVEGRKLSLKIGAWNKRIAVWVPMGAVNFTPNREALYYKERTNRVISQIVRTLLQKVTAKAMDDIATCKNHTEAFKAAGRWSFMRGITLRYRGVQIPSTITAQDAWTLRRSRASSGVSVGHSNIDSYAVITDFTNAAISPGNRARIQAYCEEHGINETLFLVSEGQVGAPWTDDLTIISWDDIKAWKMPRAQRANVSSDGTYRVYDESQRKFVNLEGGDIPDSSTVVYFSTADYDPTTSRASAALNIAYDKGNEPQRMYVVMSKNRWKKFKREHPEALHFKNALVDEYKRWAKSLSADEQRILALYSDEFGGHLRKTLRALVDHATDIKDPKVQDVVATYGSLTKPDEVHKVQHIYRQFKAQFYSYFITEPEGAFKLREKFVNELKEALDGYTLLRYAHDTPVAVEYLNAVYTYRNNNNDIDTESKEGQ